jgi:polar amino acid transport system substrate-binding protein
MKRYGLICLVSLLLASAMYSQNKITLGVPESPPYFSEKLNGQGMVCELLTAAFKSQGYDVSYQFFPLARLFTTLTEGRVAGIPYGLGSLSAEDQAKVVESKPIYLSEYVLFYKKAKFPKGVSFNDLSELKSYTVEVKNGNAPIIDLLTSKGLKLDLGNASDQMFQKIVLDRADFIAIPDLGGLDLIKSLSLKEDDYDFTKFISSSNRTMMFMKTGNEGVISAFNAGYASIMKNGTYKKILEKYYGAGKVPASHLKLISVW